VINLVVNGVEFSGWESARASRSMESAAGGFSLVVSNAGELFPIGLNDYCELNYGDKRVVSGFIDKITASLSSDEHTVTVVGKDKTVDLVESSAVHPTGQWDGVGVEQVIRDLIAPYGIELVVQADDLGTLFDTQKFTIQQGESPFSAIERALSTRGLMVTSDELGRLVILRPGGSHSGAALIEGENVLSCEATFSSSNKFSEYIVKGQAQNNKGGLSPLDAAQVVGKASDSSVNRYRPKIVNADLNSTSGDAQSRAEFETTIRSSRGDTFSISVQGWLKPDGNLWAVNEKVSCEIPTLKMLGFFLITGVEFSQTIGEGTKTSLQVKHLGAFDTQASKPDSGLGIDKESSFNTGGR